MRHLSSVFALSLLAACGNGGETGDQVRLDWTQGDMWNVGARYEIEHAKTEEVPHSLEGGEEPVIGENWTDEIVWTYQVVETGFVPHENDELYAYAVNGDGSVAEISVVRAWVDVSLNDDPELLEADPVIYLVFREQHDRLAAIVQFVNVDGDRLEKAWSTTSLERSWSPLSQSMLTGLPTYLAPSAAKWTSEELVLENGSLMTTEAADDGAVDVYYDDEIGGGLVMNRYEAGQPWPTYTAADGVEARLLDESEVAARRAARPYLPEAPEDFDYVRALSQTVNVDAALKLDADTIDGGFESFAYDEYKPWAGSWWRQSEAALVFGYDGRQTVSDRIKSTIDPIKTEMDRLSEDMRKLDQSSSEYSTKLATYKEKQTKLVDELVKFYDAILADLDGGKIKIQSGRLVHTTAGWSYDLDELSPMDKFALQQYYRGETYPNPFYSPAWELLNHYSPAGGSWWGHCNGWAAAAILTNEPRESKTVSMNGTNVEYTSADIKGLFSESHYSTYSRFYGTRYNSDKDNVADLTPKAFHILVTHYLRDRRVPLVFDTTATEEVWNFPAYGVELDVRETTAGATGTTSKTNLNTADRYALDALPGIGFATADKIIAWRTANGPFQTVEDVKKVGGISSSNFNKFKDLVTTSVATGERTFEVDAIVTFATDGVGEEHVDGDEPQSFTETYEYTLVTDANGLVLRGTWKDDRHHPDFAWVPYDNPMSASSGNSENPYMSYGDILDTVGKEYKRQ